MGERHIGVIINGATGRMGTTQHMANLLAIAAEGGLALRNGDRLIPDLLLVGRDAGRLKALAAAQRQPALDHEPRRGVGGSGRDLHGLRRHRRSAGARAPGDRGGQAHPYRKADRAHGRGGNGAGARGACGRREARRDPGQAVPARLRQAAVRQERRLLWAHPVDPHRCGVLDLRRQDRRNASGRAGTTSAPRAAGLRSI